MKNKMQTIGCIKRSSKCIKRCYRITSYSTNLEVGAASEETITEQRRNSSTELQHAPVTVSNTVPTTALPGKDDDQLY